jgi:hypothetical protein
MDSRWSRMTILAVATACLSSLSFAAQNICSQEAPQKAEAPTLRIDVRRLADSKRESDRCVQCAHIAFVDGDTIALTLMTSVTPPKPQTGKFVARSGPTQFRLFLIDAKTGQVRVKKEWATDSSSIALLPTHAGRFLIATSEEISLFSSSLELLGHRNLPPKGPGSTFPEVITSFGGHVLVIKSYENKIARLQLVDTESFGVIHSWSVVEPVLNVTAADDAVVIETRNQIQFSKIDGPWKTLYTLSDPRSCTNNLMRPQFIAPNALALKGCENQIIGMDTSGNLRFQTQPFSTHSDIFTLTASGNGRLFGALVFKNYCAASWSECLFDPIQGAGPDRAMVYDAMKGRTILEGSLAGDRKDTIGEMALSPDGALLAILHKVHAGRIDGVIELFRIQASANSKP